MLLVGIRGKLRWVPVRHHGLRGNSDVVPVVHTLIPRCIPRLQGNRIVHVFYRIMHG